MYFSNTRSALSSNQWFTLIELIIAMAVFSIGLVGAYMMLERSNFLSTSSQDEIIAYNLMRSDIEEIKNMRDTNWVALRDWNASNEKTTPTKYLANWKDYILKETLTTIAWSDKSVLSLTEPVAGTDDNKLCRQSSTPRYGYCDAIYTTPTKFRKVLKVETIWSDDGSSSMPDTLKITSIVSTEIPKRTYTLSTLITDWKR